MAEFLIRAIDNTMPLGNDAKDEAGSYKRGDIVEVYPDGTCTEPPAPGSNAYIIILPGYSLDKAKALVETERYADRVLIKRRRYRFPFDRLTDTQKETLLRTRTLTIYLITALYMYDKRERVSKWL